MPMVKGKMAFMLALGLCITTFLLGCNNGRATEPVAKEPETTAQSSNTSEQKYEKTDEESMTEHGGSFDFEAKAVTLNNGYEMPIIGIETWMLDDDTAENAVYHALKDGYRLIDTARYYGNAVGIQNGVKRAIEEGTVSREEIFITTKIVPYGFDDYSAAIEECNEALGLGYIDLMLIHQQGADEIELYRAIENAIDDKIVRSLGISNYYAEEDFARVTEGARIMPCIIQNENHPYYQNTDFQQYVSQYGIIIESYYSFGGRGHTQDLFGDETIVKIAETHNITSAQVLLRWQLQAGYIAIPGSGNPDHIAENFDIFDFELSDGEMSEIADMNTGERYESW